MQRSLFILILVVSTFGCNQKNGVSGSSGKAQDTALFNKKLVVPNKQVILLPKVQQLTGDWLAYVTAQSEINNFKTYTVKGVASNAAPIAEIMLSLWETIPDSLNSNAVQSRINVLYTKARVLQQLSAKREPNAKSIETTAEEIPTDFNNFKIQLNELFLKSLDDFERELDLQEKKDSISRIKAQKVDSLKSEIN